MENKDTINSLNGLLQITNDRLEGFKNVDTKMISSYPKLSDVYERMVTQAAEMRTDLANLIKEIGGDLENSTSLAGDLHRSWIDLKNSLSMNRDEATLESVVFGETAAMKAYEKVLEKGNLSEKTSIVIKNQLDIIKDSVEKFKYLKEGKS